MAPTALNNVGRSAIQMVRYNGNGAIGGLTRLARHVTFSESEMSREETGETELKKQKAAMESGDRSSLG